MSHPEIPAIIYPVISLAVLTLIVATLMYIRRVSYMKKNRVHPQKVQNRAQALEQLPDTRASDNYLNLFEMPILFYVAAFIILVMNFDSKVLLTLSWAYVAFRVTHSMIHCSYNTVMHRFTAFMLSVITLVTIWLLLLAQLIFGVTL